MSINDCQKSTGLIGVSPGVVGEIPPKPPSGAVRLFKFNDFAEARYGKESLDYCGYQRSITINKKYRDKIACFSLAHEIGHLIDEMSGNEAYLSDWTLSKNEYAIEKSAWYNAKKLLRKYGFTNWRRFIDNKMFSNMKISRQSTIQISRRGFE
jgi:Zn-dependent peptidase ImmA (M78 family)